jgi:hypothetical protein
MKKGDVYDFMSYWFINLLQGITMPKNARIDAEGTIHHIISRGMEQRKIKPTGYKLDK